jgi:hypothetical protein
MKGVRQGSKSRLAPSTVVQARSSVFRDALQVRPGRIAAFNDAELNEFMRELLHAQAPRCGAVSSEIRVNTELKASDDGADGWSPKPALSDPWLGAVETCWQFKAGAWFDEHSDAGAALYRCADKDPFGVWSDFAPYLLNCVPGLRSQHALCARWQNEFNSVKRKTSYGSVAPLMRAPKLRAFVMGHAVRSVGVVPPSTSPASEIVATRQPMSRVAHAGGRRFNRSPLPCGRRGA